MVFLLDEFDAFLENDIFHQAEFYGGLRALASRSQGLVLVIASRRSLSALNTDTQNFNRTGSPYFNFMDEIFLRPFTRKASEALLALGGETFTKQDREFLLGLAGGHPYFLQSAASALWEAYQDEEIDAQERQDIVRENLATRIEPTLEDIWRLWTPAMKKAFGIIALDEMPLLLGEKKFHIPNLLKSLGNYAPEIKTLKKRGFIKEEARLDSGYSVSADIMLSFVADKLLAALRENDEMTSWLQREEWDGMFTKGEKKQLLKAAKTLASFLKEGIELLAKARSL